MGKKYKERLIPEQDRRICGSICMCQLTVVMSCVALVYLTVAIYIPSHRAFQSGLETTPVMCQTVNTTMVSSYCDWASCGEWCLTKTSGFCPQIHVTVRMNATNLRFENCTRQANVPCPQAKFEKMTSYNCNNGSACHALTGVFNCSLGHCANMSELYQCHYKADGIHVDSEQDNLKLNGFFECNKSQCIKIKQAFSCDRYCPKITTSGANVFITEDDSLHTAVCQRVLASNRNNGTEIATELDEPVEIWRQGDNNKVFVASCHTVTKNFNENSMKATDCLNGTLIDEDLLPTPFMNFTTFWSLVEASHEPVDVAQNYVPMQSELTIYNSSKLYINLEACVNTLQGECKVFLVSHGRDGDNQTAQSRFPCYYDKNFDYFVVAKFDLRKTWIELMVAVIVPCCLFLLSCATLCIITRSVKVGDDAKMRCKYCTTDMEDAEEDDDDEGDQLTPGAEADRDAAAVNNVEERLREN